MRHFVFTAALLAAGPCLADPLPSWNDGASKSAIIAFVESVTDPASPDYVTPADRIATFDNDGTLWAEQPLYFQFLFAFDRLRKLAAEDESILTSDVLRAANAGDLETVAAAGEAGLLEIQSVTHAGMTVDEFLAESRQWLATTQHPDTGKPLVTMTYQPMLELLSYLRDEDFTTWIVSGGGIDFIRSFADDTYGIPPWQVVGTEANTVYAVGEDGTPTLSKEGGVTFIDDKEGKPVGIMRHIGQRPIFAAGNSDGDFAMLEWTTAGDGARFGLIVHHTDAEREFAYDREGHVGVLDRGLDEAAGRGWVLVDMANDWRRVWPDGE
ncbi:HAD family hydrolase [Pukyongiella litopenaei]|uniref:Haloacid dehalogenase-like hydrolase n=1 Tax=Pukyongiella litopenaei TaxID=2605946 RepID=A0A2S0MTL7_9RHOB|nr:HAD family hydrolase [Pukyongiella litopenaei]AVO39071.1 haloacid dehalogenase-like hydrolase [Pukyongiella litopenaei]